MLVFLWGPKTVSVWKEACPCLSRRWPGSRPGPHGGSILGLSEACWSFWSENVPRDHHYWVTTVSVWAGIWAKWGCTRTGPEAVHCQGRGLWRSAGSCNSCHAVLAADNSSLPRSKLSHTYNLGRFRWISPWYVCTFTYTFVYLCMLIRINAYGCVFMCKFLFCEGVWNSSARIRECCGDRCCVL